MSTNIEGHSPRRDAGDTGYVCAVLASLGDLPKGEWETVDFLDGDPAKGEGLAPIRVKLTLDGSGIHYDLTGSAEAVSTFLNSGYGTTFSAIYAGTKTFFPEVPLNSGFYQAVTAEIGEEGTVVNAGWPHAVPDSVRDHTRRS